jgi:hypothetical protein
MDQKTKQARAFDAPACPIPTAPVTDIHSCCLAEDGETPVITVDLQDRSTALISVCPGRPIAITVHNGLQ